MTSNDRGKVLAASLTPLNADSSIDDVNFAAHVKRLLADGCDGVVLFGTTGEGNSFSVAERCAALETLLASGVRPGQLMVGTGCCALADTVQLTRHAVSSGVENVLVLPPFYYKGADDDGLYAYFSSYVEETGDTDVRVYLYHFPKMAVVSFSHELVGRLASAFPHRIVGVKDSTGDEAHTMSLKDAFPALEIYAGTEMFLLDYLLAGGAGCISATANITARLAAAVRDGAGEDAAVALQRLLSEVRGVLQRYPATGALKRLLAVRSGNGDWVHVRAPLKSLSEQDAGNLVENLQALGFDLG